MRDMSASRWDSPDGLVYQAKHRRLGRLYIHVPQEPKSKKAMTLREKVSVQRDVLAQMMEFNRHAFRGPIAADL